MDPLSYKYSSTSFESLPNNPTLSQPLTPAQSCPTTTTHCQKASSLYINLKESTSIATSKPLKMLYYENHLNSTNESFPVSVTKDYASNMTMIQLSIFATFCTCVCAYLAFTVYKLAQPRPPVRRIARVASDLDQLPLKSAMSLKGRAMSFIFALTDASKDALVALNLRKSPPPSVVDTTSDVELISDTSDDSDTEDEMVFFITKRHRNRMVDVAEAEADHEHAQSVDD